MAVPVKRVVKIFKAQYVQDVLGSNFQYIQHPLSKCDIQFVKGRSL